MNERRLMDQVNAVFGVFMTFFYIGIGLYVALSDRFLLDKFVTGLFGFTFTLYGVYRGYRSYVKIKEVFFKSDEEE